MLFIQSMIVSIIKNSIFLIYQIAWLYYYYSVGYNDINVIIVLDLYPHFCEDVNILKIVYFVLLANYYYYHF